MPRPQFTLKTLLLLMAVVAAVLVAFSEGRRYEQAKLHAERERLAKKQADYEQMESVMMQIAHEHAETLAAEHPDLANKWRCVYSRDD